MPRCDWHDEAQPSTTDFRKSPAMQQCIWYPALPNGYGEGTRALAKRNRCAEHGHRVHPLAALAP